MPFPGPDALGAIVALLFAMGAMGAQSALVRLLMRGRGLDQRDDYQYDTARHQRG